MTCPVPGPTTAEWVRLFEATHVGLTERDLERADHAETRKLVRGLEDDLRWAKAQLGESEMVRRGQAEELAQWRSGDTADLTAVTESVAEVLEAALEGGDAKVLALVTRAQAGRLRALVGGREQVAAR